MCKNYKSSNGITLVALVVTIVVLLILAGISINMVLGENGIIKKAGDAANDTKTSSAKEKVSIMLSEYGIDKYTTTEGNDLISYFTSKKEKGEIDEVTDNNDGTITVEVDGYLVTIDADEKVTDVNKAGPRPQVSNIRVVSNSDGSGTTLGASSTEDGTTLYINFDSSIEGGTITSVNPTLPYAVTANGKTTFTVTGKVGSDTYTKTVTVNVNQYESGLKIGTYVRYGVSYTDTYTSHDFTTEEGRGWRVLDPGTDNGNGTYSNVKLVSTGIPAKLYYYYSSISSAPWKGTDAQISDYTSKFYASSSATNYNMYAAAGLYYNFGKIVFNQGTSAGTQNTGYFTKVNNKTTGTLAEDEFVTGNATEVHNLTMYELNKARNKKAGTDSFALNQTDGASSYSTVTTANDAATGLFYLRGLNNYGYTSDSLPYYWLASPGSDATGYVWFVSYDGDFGRSYTTLGVRPVVSLTSVSTSDIVGN